MGQLVFQATLGGQVNLVGPNTASTLNINVPAFAGTMASLASVTNNGVNYVNSSGQPTSGSAFVFDGTNVGIGTASPSQRLSVSGGLLVTDEIKGNNNLNLQKSTLNNIYYTDAIAFAKSGTGESMRIDSSGNVGIGTSTTPYRLNVQSSVGTMAQFNGNNANNYLQLSDNNGTNNCSIGSISGGNWYLYTNGYGVFYTGGANERMRIDSSGNLLVGTTSTVGSERLNVTQTTANLGLFVNVAAASSTANPAISCRKYDNSNTTAQTYLTFAFNQGTSGAGGIQGNGATGVQFYSSSDTRLKENIVELEPQLANILALKPSKFDFIDGPKDCTGFIAQEMEKVYPDAVGETPDGYKTIGGISIMETRLIKAIQEQQAIITQLQVEIAALKSK
ncbi:Intramolecular chaperone auto-processing domain containing protein [uncultured Caudovirales phage]|uniref:Intramolecular chaperone auto-processing domain containing protein n=1 Tax=uncultured Caudovirales phage TaxID=2100421 RepID=A0A6J7WMW5_9CAUD|nr:Intramolecular chaperone auto-processing domain containing protein [uncultured Caudovirales phage]